MLTNLPINNYPGAQGFLEEKKNKLISRLYQSSKAVSMSVFVCSPYFFKLVDPKELMILVGMQMVLG